MQKAVLSREERGRAIAETPNQIQRLDEKFYKVASQSGRGMYSVVRTDKFAIGWICDCPDFTYRQVKCKHIWACEISVAMRTEVERHVVIQPLSPKVCIYCGSIGKLVKHGLRHNSYGDLQRLTCRSCGKRFTQNIGFERMKVTPEAVSTAMQLYFTGESLRNVQKLLRLQGVEVSHVSIYNWIRKYIALMEKYLKQIKPQVSNTWRADELYVKVHGDMKYLYALMDDQTRFWISQQVADSKYTADITPLFRSAKKTAGKAPSTLITDGAFNFHSAYEKAFYREKKALAIQHIRHIRMAGDLNNQKMERMNGEIRDREKVVRGVKKEDSPLLTGLQIYHNYVRPHMGLDGKTPAAKAGIEIEGQDKWLTLIQNASRVQRLDGRCGRSTTTK
jgi:putative transposase